MVQMDFCFMDSDKGERVADILNMTDCMSDAIGATMLPGKEISEYPVVFGAQTIDVLGRARCVLRTDQEVTIRKLAAETAWADPEQPEACDFFTFWVRDTSTAFTANAGEGMRLSLV